MGFFGDIWSGIKTVATAPYKLVTSVGSAAFDGIKAIGHFGGKVANTVVDTASNAANTAIALPNKVINTVDNGVDKISGTIDGIFKSPILLFGGIIGLYVISKT